MRIIITESQLRKIVKNILNEEISPGYTKEFLEIERSPEAEARMIEVFNKLKSLPNARQLDDSGSRISFPYSSDPTESEIENILKRYQFEIKDYENNLAIDMRSNKEIALSRALSIVSKKEPIAKDLMDRYASMKSKGIIKKNENLMMVFSNKKYDILSMSTDRKWRSCMNIIDGKKRRYVKVDIREGSIICYLTKNDDINLEKPLGRILIKAHLSILNKKDVVLYPELHTYGNIPNPENFIDMVEEYMEKTQNHSGHYKRLSCLYPDSIRSQIEFSQKEKNRKSVIEKVDKGLGDGTYISENEFLYAPIIYKRKIIEYNLSIGRRLYDYHFESASQSQRKRYIMTLIQEKTKYSPIPYYVFDGAPKDMKKEIIDYEIEYGWNRLNDVQFDIATPEQKERYIKKLISKKERISHNIFLKSPQNVKEYIIDNMLENNEILHVERFFSATPEQKERALKPFKETLLTRFQNGSVLNFLEFYLLTPEQKEKYITIKIITSRGYGLTDYEFKFATPFQKKNAIDAALKGTGTYLTRNQFMESTQEQKEKYIENTIKNRLGSGSLPNYAFKYARPDQKERYRHMVKMGDDTDS
jgi:hypothetical protein